MPISYYQFCCARGSGAHSPESAGRRSRRRRHSAARICRDVTVDRSDAGRAGEPEAAAAAAPLARQQRRANQSCARRFEEIELKCYNLSEGCALLDANHDYRLLVRNSSPAPVQSQPPAAPPARAQLERELGDSRALLDVRPEGLSLVRFEVDPDSGQLGSPLEAPRPVTCESLSESFELVSGRQSPELEREPRQQATESERLLSGDSRALDDSESQHQHQHQEQGEEPPQPAARKRSKFARRLNRLLSFVHLAPRRPKGARDKADKLRAAAGRPPSRRCRFPIMISYQRHEGQTYALALRSALQTLGLAAYVDVLEIQSGTDWQDSLNEAILECRAFVALVTPSYGETLWTSREVKLADVLGKQIIPVNFGQSWPPAALAIQFATLQYIPWRASLAKPRAPELDSTSTSSESWPLEPMVSGGGGGGRDLDADGEANDESGDLGERGLESPSRWRRRKRMPKWPDECVASVARKILLSIWNYYSIDGHERRPSGDVGSADQLAAAAAPKSQRTDSGYDSSPAPQDECAGTRRLSSGAGCKGQPEPQRPARDERADYHSHRVRTYGACNGDRHHDSDGARLTESRARRKAAPPPAAGGFQLRKLSAESPKKTRGFPKSVALMAATS